MEKGPAKCFYYLIGLNRDFSTQAAFNLQFLIKIVWLKLIQKINENGIPFMDEIGRVKYGI